MEVLVDLLERIALALDQHGGDLVAPALHQRHGLTLVDLIGLCLVGQQHQLIAVDQAADKPTNQGQRERKAAVLLHAEAQRDDRHKAEARLFERLAQQVDIVGRTAAAARLGHHQRDLVHVVFSALEGVDKLPDDQQRRIAGIVMYILESGLRDLGAGCFQQLAVIAEAAEHIGEDPKMDRRHIRHQNLIPLALHLLGKHQASGFFVIF